MAKKKDIQEELKDLENRFIKAANDMLKQAEEFEPDPERFTRLDKPGKVMTVDGRKVVVF